MNLKIVQAGHPVLRQAARPLRTEELLGPAIQQLIAHMRDTMRDAPGVGLAAPQIGISLQLAVIEDREEFLANVPAERLKERERHPVPFMVLANPKIIEASVETAEFFEGCLSVEGFSALVKRSRSVTVEFLDAQASPHRIEAGGWFARILQHEIDHLNGHLYLDHMETRSFATMDNMSRYWKDASIETVRKALGL